MYYYCNSVSAIMFLVLRLKAPKRFCLDMEGWTMSMNACFCMAKCFLAQGLFFCAGKRLITTTTIYAEIYNKF